MLTQLIVGLAVAGVLTGEAAAGSLEKPLVEPALLSCKAKDYVDLADDGSLGSKNAGSWLQDSGFIVDLSSGVIRFPGLPPVRWIVIQDGNSSSDFVLSPLSFALSDDDPKDVAASATTDFLRVRTWGIAEKMEVPIRFLMVRLTQIFAGVCVAVNP